MLDHGIEIHKIRRETMSNHARLKIAEWLHEKQFILVTKMPLLKDHPIKEGEITDKPKNKKRDKKRKEKELI